METPTIEEPKQLESYEKKTDSSSEIDIREILYRPGERLILPSEESEIYRGEEKDSKVFSGKRIVGGSSGKTNPHKQIGYTSFAKIYANELAASQIENINPLFPVGSMIAREKLNSEISTTPEFLTVMVKRENGFSKQTGDWEYLTFNGENFTLQARETKSSCSKCHASAKETDFVFRTYLKK